MSTTTSTSSTEAGHGPDVDPTVHTHPTDAQYIKIALILAVITAAEVGTYFWEGASTVGLVAVLFPMMIAKFAIVLGYFMHLKYDNRLFRRVFVFGLILAIVVYMVMLFAFEFWDDQYLKFLRG